MTVFDVKYYNKYKTASSGKAPTQEFCSGYQAQFDRLW